MRKVERSVPPKIKVTEKNHTRQSLTEFYCRGSVNLRIFGRFYEKAGSVSVCNPIEKWCASARLSHFSSLLVV